MQNLLQWSILIFILTLFIEAEVCRSLPKLLLCLLTIGKISKLVLAFNALLGEIPLCVMVLLYQVSLDLLRWLHIYLDSPRLFLTCLALTIIIGTESFLDMILSIHHTRVYHLNVLRELWNASLVSNSW